MNDPTNYTLVSPWALLPNPISKHIEMTGWGGLGMDFSLLLTLWPSLVFAVIFYNLRWMLYAPFRSLGVACGILATQKSKMRKFQYQCWLLLFYTLSSIFGFYVLQDKPWFGLPMSEWNQMNLFVDHPQRPDDSIVWYYCYEFGFFLAEIFVIFQETRRSDFVEYVVHHVCTLLLMSLSFVGYEHRIGSYILFIHDISDIPLCFTKLLHYVKANEWFVNCNFAVFVGVFAFTRLICLPIHGIGVLFVATGMRICTVNFWVLSILLQFVLQGLHVYWFWLIIKLLWKLLFSPFRGDIRSDSDAEVTPQKATKSKLTGKKSK